MIARALPSAAAIVVLAIHCVIVPVTSPLLAQSNLSEPRLLYSARGTGRTTGHVITLYVSNPSPVPLRTEIGDCLIPPSEYQGYLIPDVYPVEVAPFSTERVDLKGYCLNVGQPALAEGAAAVDVSQWISWQEATPLPESGKPLPAAFVPTAIHAESALALSYPGTNIPFPFTIDFQKHPREVTRLLLHKVYATDIAFENIGRDGKLPPALNGRSGLTLKDDIIQQVLWNYAAQLSGKTYSKVHFETQLKEEAEQQVNQTADQFSKETQLQLERQTQDVWAAIALVGAEAKLVSVPDKPHSDQLFKASPTGPAADPNSAITSILGKIDPTEPEAGDQLAPVLDFLERYLTTPELHEKAGTQWHSFITNSTDRLKPVPITPLGDFLSTLYHIERNPGNILTPEAQNRARLEVTNTLQNYLHNSAVALQPTDLNYLEKWRMLRSRQSAPWYKTYLGDADPLKLMTDSPLKTTRTTAFNPSKLALIGDSWKVPFPPTPEAAPRKIPLWVPIAGIPVIGTVAYLLLKEDKDNTPAPPTAIVDEITLPCGGQSDLNVLTNDTGEGIALTSAGGDANIAIEILDLQRVRITAAGSGQFIAIYTIADRAGQSATGTILINVTDQSAPVISCPPSITLEGCGEIPPLSATGQASATDDCDATPTTGFTDEISGSPCNFIITRIWTAADASGKNATCSQTITVQDKLAPVINCPTDLTVSLGDQNDLELTGQATAEDACTPAIDPAFTDDLSGMDTCSGVVIRIWTAADDCANATTCTQIITVVDDLSPTLTCPPPVSVDCGKQNDLSLTGQATAQDNCTGPLSPVFTDNPPTFTGCSGEVVRTWTAIDPAGNSAACTQLISINDLSAPVFTVCPVPITVNCGQQNDLVITGQPVVTDLCNGPSVVITFTDDLSQFIGCEGTITRTFIASDPCGNTAVCQQVITVTGVPCNFTPIFNIDPAFCGNCNGTALVTINPPGTYEFVWGNGENGPVANLLCPGTMEVTVTDLVNGCSEVFTTFIPEQPTLTLTVQQVIQPSGPSSNDGRVSLLITPPGAEPPFLVFVNGMPLGLVGTTFFQITDLPAGEYEIFVVDNGGEGCPSNTVLVIMMPQALLPPLEISIPGSNPGIYHNPESITTVFSTQTPEHPATEPLRAHYLWTPAWGIAAGISFAEYYQLRLEAARQSGLLLSSTATGLTYQTPVQADYTMIGARRYSPQHSKWTFFQEINAARITLRSGNTWSVAAQQWLTTAQQEAFWQSSIGGGLRRQLAPNLTLEANLQLTIQLRENARKTTWSPTVNIRLQSAIRNP